MTDREDAWWRRKGYREKWPRFSAEIAPELAELLDKAQRVSMGINWDGYKPRPTNATRANMVRSALRLYLNATMPEGPPDVDGTAIEVIDLPALDA